MEKLPVRQGRIDYSKDTIKNKETGDIMEFSMTELEQYLRTYNAER